MKPADPCPVCGGDHDRISREDAPECYDADHVGQVPSHEAEAREYAASQRSGPADTRPAIVTDEHLDYLDTLRETGVVNMFASGAWVRRRFDLSPIAARQVLTYWMTSYAERHPK